VAPITLALLRRWFAVSQRSTYPHISVLAPSMGFWPAPRPIRFVQVAPPSRRPVLIHSSNRIRYGNCDWPGVETASGYLTRLGAVSNHSWPHSSFFRVTDGARTPPEELVNIASAIQPFGSTSEGLNQPAWPNRSPVAWEYPRGE
jgi:hypothetical protein